MVRGTWSSLQTPNIMEQSWDVIEQGPLPPTPQHHKGSSPNVHVSMSREVRIVLAWWEGPIKFLAGGFNVVADQWRSLLCHRCNLANVWMLWFFFFVTIKLTQFGISCKNLNLDGSSRPFFASVKRQQTVSHLLHHHGEQHLKAWMGILLQMGHEHILLQC